MKKIYNHLSDHLKEEFDWKFHSIWILILASGVAFRYITKFDFSFRYSEWRFLTGILFYAVPYFVTVFLYAFIKEKTDFLHQKGFWILSAVIIFVLYANDKLTFYKLFSANEPFQIRYFINKISFNLHSTFFYLAIPFVYWKLIDKPKGISFYGLDTKEFDFKPYVIMLLIMLPFLVWASFQPDFIKAYPRYKAVYFEPYVNINPWFTVPFYEFSYAIQFIGLEIFFRGFIVLALAKYMGKGSVWVMVALYGYMHFGKPMAECVSSFFGGYILGTIALYTRNTYGGMFIHIGIALGMELLAYLQLFVF